LLHGGMLAEHVVDLPRADLLAAAVDDLLQPAGDGQIAVLVEHALVAGTEPAVDESRFIGLGIALIAAGDVRPPNDDLTAGAGLHEEALLVHNADFGAGRDADGSSLASARRQRVRGHLVRRLGHAVSLDDGAAE